MAEYATMAALDIWHQRVDLEPLIKRMPKNSERDRTRKMVNRALRKDLPSHVYPLLARGRTAAIKDNPP